MVFLDPTDHDAGQLHRHGASHLPNGLDPVFIPTNSDTKDGSIIVYVNGVPTIQNISNVVNSYLTSLFGAGMLGGGGEDGDQGPPGPPGAIGATGAAGAVGASGTGTQGPPGMDGTDGDDGLGMMRPVITAVRTTIMDFGSNASGQDYTP